MTDIVKTLDDSMALYRELKETMDRIEGKLALLDLEKTVQVTRQLERLHERIAALDNRLMAELTPDNVNELSGHFEERKTMITTVLQQNKRLLPKLKTRLTGYRVELLKIRSGITTMQGYQQKNDSRGRRINSMN